VEAVRKILSGEEAIQYLHQLESINRHSVKRIVLDCSEKVVKDILVKHVNSVR